MNSEKVKHTPGPWEAKRQGGYFPHVMAGKLNLAETDCSMLQGDWVMDIDEATANARLIAAAPELLAFAKQFEAYCTENCQTGEISWDALQIAAQSAINKATGGVS